jgi:hypothetical protein
MNHGIATGQQIPSNKHCTKHSEKNTFKYDRLATHYIDQSKQLFLELV